MGVLDSGPVLLDGPDTMLTVLQELVGPDALTWRGTVDVWGEPGKSARWRIGVNDDKGNSVTALQGQYLVLTYGRLLVLDADEVQA